MSVNNSIVPTNIEGIVERLIFGWIDYSFFITMISVSTIVGIYFGFFSKKQNTPTEYLLGGKTLSCFPVAMSTTASHLSGITLLGLPTEVYQYGTQYAVCVFTTVITGFVTIYIFLPVFYKLQLTSTFEYLEVRFGRSVRQFASFLFTISLVLHIPIVIYGPALAFAQVTGFDLHYITPVIGFICIFYTCIGGLKALVWTDTIQFTVTVLTLFTVLTLGVISIGGFSEIWRISGEGNRLVFFDMNPNPFVRSSFWAIAIGLTTTWISNISISQTSVQRFLAVSTLSEAKMSIWLLCLGIIIVKFISIYTGLIMYTKYYDCDPVKTGAVDRPDQILPYYVMDVTRGIPGLPGLFLAALVSAALSSMSCALNTAAGTIWEDFISPWVRDSETKEQTGTKVMKVIVVVLGVVCVALVFVVERMGQIFTMSLTVTGVTSGTLIGLFTLGMLVPWANYKGTVIGGTIGFILSTGAIMSAQIHRINKNIRYDPLPTSTENCSFPFNVTEFTTSTLPPVQPEDDLTIIFALSVLYYSFVGFTTVLICGIIASMLTGGSDLKELNRDLFSPIIHRFLPPSKYTEVPIMGVPMISRNSEKEKEATM